MSSHDADPATSPTTDRDDPLRERFRGALVGTFVGDALGAPVEGRSPGQILRTHGQVPSWSGRTAPRRR